MNHLDITLYLNEYRVRALADALGQQTAETVEDKLQEAFDMLYQEYVPDDQRATIEARIEREDAEEQMRMEAKRRFAVYHIREHGEDYHFTSDHFQSPMQAAYRFRLYSRGELSSKPDALAAAFIETQPISMEKFNEANTDINSDKRITALVDFDLDNGCVSYCDSSDNAWWIYNLHDFSVAAYKALRSDYRSEECRREIFHSSLAGKEIFPPDEDESLAGKEIDPPEAAEHTVPQSGVIHICENGKDTYFISHGTHSFLTAANLYRQYENGTAIGNPSTFASAFGGVEKISMEAFDAHSDHIPYDPQIKFSAEFFLDGGVCSVLDSNDNCWWYYELSDVSEAAQKAYRQSDLPMSKRQEVFDNNLCGKELDPDEWVERKHGGNSDGTDEAPAMRM